MNHFEYSIKSVENLLKKGKLNKAVLSLEEIIASPNVKTQLEQNADYKDIKNSIIALSANVSEIKQDLQNGMIDHESLSIKKNSVLQKTLVVLEKIAEHGNLQIPIATSFQVGINGVKKSKKNKNLKKRFNYFIIILSSLITISIIGFLVLFRPFSILEGENFIIENGQENEKTLMDDVQIEVNVITLDNFKLSDKDWEAIIKIQTKLGFTQIDSTGYNFNTYDIFINDRLQFNDPSFKRVDQLLKDNDLNPYFSDSDRKKLITSNEYWRLKKINPTPKLLILPKENNLL